MRTKLICIMYLSFIFTGMWLAQAKLPLLKEDAWLVQIKY